jgi:hypothetical protein
MAREKLNASHLAILSTMDGFPVSWADRDEYGNHRLSSQVFKVVETPPPLFGQNIEMFGLETALEMAGDCMPESGEYPRHNFGECFLKGKSLRQIDGRWYVDLSVANHNARYHKVPKIKYEIDASGEILLDDNGDPVPQLDEKGQQLIWMSDKKESYITVELTAIEPVMTDKIFSVPYLQRDSRMQAALAVTQQSEKLADQTAKAANGKKAVTKTLTPKQYLLQKAREKVSG